MPIQLLINGDPIYTDPEQAPFRITQYTPLYFSIVSFFFTLTEWSPFEVHKVFIASRFFSTLFTFASVFFSGYLIFILTKRNKVVAILSAFYIYHVLAFWFLTSSRPDSLLVLLTSLYLIMIYKALSTSKMKELWWYAAIFVAVTAFFVKQSGAIHSIALGGFCLFTRQWQVFAKITIAGILFFLLYLFILPINTIPVFFANIIGGVSNSVSWDWFYDWTLEKWLLQFVVLVTMNIVISAYIFHKRQTSFYLFLSFCSFLFLIFATLTSLKIGAGVGYYQDYLIVTVTQIAAFLADRTQAENFRGELSRIALPVYLGFVYLHCTLFIWMHYKDISSGDYEGKYNEQKEVSQFILKNGELGEGDWVFVDDGDNFSGYFIRHFLFKHVLIPFPDVVFLTDKNKTFQFSAFRKMADNGEIRYVITQAGRTPENVLNHTFNMLRLVRTIGAYDIYESKSIAGD